MRTLSLLVLLLLALPAAADILPVGDPVPVGGVNIADDADLRVVADGNGGAVVVWRDSGFRAVPVGPDGAPAGAALDLPEAVAIDAAGNDGRVAMAWSSFDPCGVRVFEAGGAIAFDLVLDDFGCTIGDAAVAWLDHETVAFARQLVDPRSSLSLVSIVDLTDGSVVEFEPAFGFGRAGVPAIDADSGEVVVTLAGVDSDPTVRTFQRFDADGAPTGEPVVVFEGSRTPALARFTGNGLVAAGSRCSGSDCGRPMIRRFDLSDQPVDRFEPVSEGLSEATPSLRFELAGLQRGADGSLLARWGLRPDGLAERMVARVNLILDASGEVRTDEHAFRAVTDRDLHLRHGIDPDTAAGAVVDVDRALVAWAAGQEVLARPFQRVEGSGAEEFAVRLDTNACAEDLAWTRISVFSNPGPTEVRRSSPDGELVATVTDLSGTVETLARFGDSFYFVAAGTGALRATATLLRSDFSTRCEPNSLTVTATSAPGPAGAFSAEVSFIERSPVTDNIEIRLNAPDGKLFAASPDASGTFETGPWVRDGLLFFLIDADPPRRGSVIDLAVARP